MAKKMIRPLHSEAEYDAALKEIAQYFENEPKLGTPDADRFDLLALIVEDYERKHWPIEPADTIDAIRYRMETGGYTQADLGRLFGSRQRASDILTGKRRLTMRMAWRLHHEWGIPAEALIAPPPRAERAHEGPRRERYDEPPRACVLHYSGGTCCPDYVSEAAWSACGHDRGVSIPSRGPAWYTCAQRMKRDQGARPGWM